MKIYFLLLASALFAVFCPNSTAAQSEPLDWLATYRSRFLPEKIFVHTDKSVYAGGETIWYATYLVDGQTHRPDSLSKLLHVELLSPQGKRIAKQNIYPADGHAAGDMPLPGNLAPGNYLLMAYTNYQRNSPEAGIFRKAIRIVSGLAENGAPPATPTRSEPNSGKGKAGKEEAALPSLRFFPEGGDCVAGIPCRVAIYAADAQGIAQSVGGYLATTDGQAATIFRTNQLGIGSFTYTPSESEAANVVVNERGGATVAEQYQLPTPLASGYHLNIFERKDTVLANVFSNTDQGLAGSRLLIHMRGVGVFERLIDQKVPQATFQLPLSEFPPGLAVVTLFDAWNEPVAERLFFIPPASEDSQLLLQTDAPSYASRTAVKTSIGFPNPTFAMDSLLAGRLSMAVLPAFANEQFGQDNIASWLLLNSDLDTPLPNAPYWIFTASARQRSKMIEDFLLTRAWRRFSWQELQEPSNTLPDYLLEDGVYVQGRMTKFDSPSEARPGKVFLTRLENAYIEEVMTDENGDFVFGPFRLFDTLNVSLQGRFRPGKRNRLAEDIGLQDNPYTALKIVEPAGPKLAVPENLSPQNPAQAIDAYQELSRKSLTVARTYDSLVIDLDVVDISAKRIDKVAAERQQRTLVYSEPDNRIEVDSIGWASNLSSTLSLLRTVPGVVVTGNQGQESVRIRGNTSINLSNDPAFFIDGVRLDIDAVRDLPVQVVEFIDVLKGARAAILGISGGNGAILVYTRRGGSGAASVQPGVLEAKLNGYHKVREFANFDYQLPENANRPDIRTTLHWAPLLKTDLLGNAQTSFFCSDQTGQYIIIAQGLRRDGRPYFGTASFQVEN